MYFLLQCAAATNDYDALSTTITFTAGDTQQDINVTTIDDNIGEGLETFTVVLSNASSGVTLGTSLVATVEISADEINVGFNPASYTVNEGENVTIAVILTGDSTTIDLMTVNGTARGNTVNFLGM